jgi:hypothetical protein
MATLDISREIREQLKTMAEKRGIKLYELVEEYLTDGLKEDEELVRIAEERIGGEDGGTN